jgi:hypothetical protein
MLRGDTRLEFDTQMNLHAVTLALALFVTSVAALEVQGDDHEAFGSSLVGRTNAEARTLIEQKYPRYSIRSGSFMSTRTRKEEIGLERYQLDCDTYLHLCFGSGAAAAERAWTAYKIELPLLKVKWEVTTQTFVQDTKS